MSILDEFEFEEEKGKKLFKLLILSVIVIMFAIYFAKLIFGDKSISTLLNLKNQNEVLEKRVKKLEKENYENQKKYFELKELRNWNWELSSFL